MKLQLKKLDMAKIKDNSVVVMIGMRNTGKTRLVKDLLYYHRDIPAGIVISPVESYYKYYSEIVPPIFIHEQYRSKITKNIIIRQNEMKKKIKAGEIDLDVRSFLVMDDCLYDNDWKKDKAILNIFFRRERRKVLFILTMLYAIGINTEIYSTIDWIFIFRENINQNRKKIYDTYAKIFCTFEIFCEVIESYTENFGCLVIHNTSKSDNLEDKVFWYRSEDHNNFRTCCKEAWIYNDENYIDNEDESEK